MKANLISIVIPVFNAEETIEPLVKNIIDELSGEQPLEIILVNDYSDDNSEEKCINIFQKNPKFIKFYSLAKNVGEHNAVMAGLNNTEGDYVVIMDDDFQNPVTEVAKLINYAKGSDLDVVYTFYSKKHHSFLRNLGSKFNDFVATIMLRKPKNLYLSSFKILNKFITQEIIKYDLPFSYLDGLILRTTQNIGAIQVEHHPRTHGKSGYTFKKLVSLWLNMFTNFSILPLRIAIFTGFIFAIIGLVLGIQTVYEKFVNPDLPTGYAAMITIFSIFSGIQLMAIGMVGEYLGRTFLSLNKKPQFTIRSELTNKKV